MKVLLQIAANVKIIENRQKAKSMQFVINFKNFIFDVLTFSSVPWIIVTKIQVHIYTSEYLA